MVGRQGQGLDPVGLEPGQRDERLCLVLPEGLAARLQLDTGMVARQLPDGYQEQGEGVYISPGYATATDRVDLNVSQAIGVLRIRQPK